MAFQNHPGVGLLAISVPQEYISLVSLGSDEGVINVFVYNDITREMKPLPHPPDAKAQQL